ENYFLLVHNLLFENVFMIWLVGDVGIVRAIAHINKQIPGAEAGTGTLGKMIQPLIRRAKEMAI
ncbi:hypothetical protein ACJX0J_021748, partial [Zea mays]